MQTVVVLGGYGQFGRHIVERLAHDAALTIVVVGRDESKARAWIETIASAAKATLLPHAVALNPVSFQQLLLQYAPKVCINTVGPFQAAQYDYPRLCIQHQVHYLDLADARDYVDGFSVLDAQAKQAKVCLLTGVSTVPALSSVVLDTLTPKFSALAEVDYCIAPGNQTDRGEATVAAILSYVGQAFSQWREGRWRSVFGWQGAVKKRWRSGMTSRWVSYCDIPDLSLFPSRYPGMQTVVFRAGLELPLLHWGLWLMSWLTRFRVVKNWQVYAPVLTRISRWFQRFGSDVGGMQVTLSGSDNDGKPIIWCWELVAAGGDGPNIPAIPAVVLCRKLLTENQMESGAGACLGRFTLAEFYEEVADLNIRFDCYEYQR
ncbi:saccharopine dehydrogenase family protein [Permianibacter aggregans]|uniref:Saccharopine dehydrogenase-like protein n=1 Tax=Permianibacter aggregans TaxID=1510150 RepID=A0A4R6UWZ3_9GAMM|nr:saccharopine dehydrogenase NADP-binding domain-containing protein [Permianibacter aggregans]TDQ48104.1 saccharopine dehydrogenase-like protein [Permianibacter aggregans]